MCPESHTAPPTQGGACINTFSPHNLVHSGPASTHWVGLMSISRYPALIPQFHSSYYYVIENKVFSIKIRVSERQVIYSFPNLMGHHSLHNADSSSAVSNREEQVDESQWEEGNVDIDPMMLGDGVLT